MIEEKTSRKLTLLTLGLSLAVIIIHTYNLEIYGIDTEAYNFTVIFEKFWWLLFNGTAVYYFAFISGVLFFRNYDFSKVKDKYSSRFKSLLIPYLVWNILYYLFFLIVGSLPFLKGVMNSEESEAGLVELFKYLWEGYGTFWYLKVIIALVIISPLIYILLKRQKYWYPEVLVVLLVALCFAKQITDSYISRDIVLALYFVIGSFVGINAPGVINIKSQKASRIAMYVLPVLMVLGYFCAGNIVYNAALFVVLWLAMDLLSYAKEPPWWLKCTFFYYCAHDMILESVEKVILIVGGRSIGMALIDFIFAPVITFGILVLGAWMLRKYMSPIWKLLNGNR